MKKLFSYFFFMTLFVSSCQTIQPVVEKNGHKITIESGSIRIVPSSTKPVTDNGGDATKPTPPTSLATDESPESEATPVGEMPLPEQQPCRKYITEIYTPDGQRVTKEAEDCPDKY